MAESRAHARTHLDDSWSSGDAYEPYVGRWSREVAREFVNWLAVPANMKWLEIGCGTGALTNAILDLARPAELHSYDSSPDYVDYTRQHVRDSRLVLGLADAHALPEPSAAFDVIVSGLVLNFLADPVRALAEQARVGRMIAAYVWDYADGMQLMRFFWDAAATLDPAARELDEGRRFPVCRPDALRATFAAAGLSNVDVRAIEVQTRFRNFDDYWLPFLGGQGPAPGYLMSLSASGREDLRALLQARLPIDHDGTIQLVARAWAVRAGPGSKIQNSPA